MKTLIGAHKFFCRESQHYVLGGWSEHITDKRRLSEYRKSFPMAYLRFMWYTLKPGAKS